MMLRPVCAALVAASVLLAQSNPFDRAPAGVEEALRERVRKFYQAHVDGKFRLADEMVAEDSKDEFFAAEKVRYYSFEIAQIHFEENYTKARVLTLAETDVLMLNNRVRIKAPLTTLWKLENGQWYWYLLKRTDGYVDTPFGRVAASQAERPGAPPPGPPAIKMPDVDSLKTMVKADKTSVSLQAAGESSDAVTIKNSMPGQIGLRLEQVQMPGLSVKLDKTEIGAGQSARVEFSFKPENGTPRGPLTVRVITTPGDIEIPIQVNFVGAAQR